MSVSILSDVDVKSLYNSIDVDGSGDIDADEFLTWVSGPEEKEEKGDGPEWAESHGYGRISPRKLCSPSQRVWHPSGWICNNDDNSEAEAAVLRRQGSKAALHEEVEKGPASPYPGRARKVIRREPETTEEQLIKVRAALAQMKIDYAKQSENNVRLLKAVEDQRVAAEKREVTMKEYRRTVAVLERRAGRN